MILSMILNTRRPGQMKTRLRFLNLNNSWSAEHSEKKAPEESREKSVLISGISGEMSRITAHHNRRYSLSHSSLQEEWEREGMPDLPQFLP